MIIHNVDQNTDQWIDLHTGIPTSSSFKLIITPKGEPSESLSDYALKLAGEVYAGKSLDAWKGNKYTDRGHEYEPEAVNYYDLFYGMTQPVGFVTDDEKQYGCSPDRFVGDDGLLEVKCLPELHLKALLYYKKHGNAPSIHIPQTQGQLFITGRKWCDLFFYHDKLPKLRVRQYPDMNYFVKLAGQLKECIALRDEYVEQIRSF